MTKRRQLLFIRCALSCLVIVLIGSFVAPPVARGVRWLQRNQPMPQSLAATVDLYRRFEEPYGIRGERFREVIFHLDRLRGTLTQREALGYLGRPDDVKTLSAKTGALVYEYDESGKRDAVVNVVFDKGILRYCAYTDKKIENTKEFWDEVAKAEGLSQKPQTKPSTRQRGGTRIQEMSRRKAE